VDRYTISSKTLAGFSDNGKELTAEEEASRDALWQHVDHKVSSVRVYALKPESLRSCT